MLGIALLFGPLSFASTPTGAPLLQERVTDGSVEPEHPGFVCSIFKNQVTWEDSDGVFASGLWIKPMRGIHLVFQIQDLIKEAANGPMLTGRLGASDLPLTEYIAYDLENHPVLLLKEGRANVKNESPSAQKLVQFLQLNCAWDFE